MSYAPFFHGFSGGFNSIEQNKNRIAELDWSADGRQFSFLIDPPRGTDNGNAGVWFWQPIVDPTHGATYQIIRDCVTDGYSPCNLRQSRRPLVLEDDRGRVVADSGQQQPAIDAILAGRKSQRAGNRSNRARPQLCQQRASSSIAMTTGIGIWTGAELP